MRALSIGLMVLRLMGIPVTLSLKVLGSHIRSYSSMFSMEGQKKFTMGIERVGKLL